MPGLVAVAAAMHDTINASMNFAVGLEELQQLLVRFFRALTSLSKVEGNTCHLPRCLHRLGV